MGDTQYSSCLYPVLHVRACILSPEFPVLHSRYHLHSHTYIAMLYSWCTRLYLFAVYTRNFLSSAKDANRLRGRLSGMFSFGWWA